MKCTRRLRPRTFHCPESALDPAQPGITLRVIAIDDDRELLELVSRALAAEPDQNSSQSSIPSKGSTCPPPPGRPSSSSIWWCPPSPAWTSIRPRRPHRPRHRCHPRGRDYSAESAVEAVRKGAASTSTNPSRVYSSATASRPSCPESVAAVALKSSKPACPTPAVSTDRRPRSGRQRGLCKNLRAAPYFRTVMIGGPTGTAKNSPPAPSITSAPWPPALSSVCNCAANPTVSSKANYSATPARVYQRHRRQTGNVRSRPRRDALLDEIGKIPSPARPNCWRRRNPRNSARRATASRKVDVRIIFATNRNLQHEVERRPSAKISSFRISMMKSTSPARGTA